MSLEGLKNFKSELLNPPRQKQAAFELGVVSLASVVVYVSGFFCKTTCSPTECLAAGLSSLVVTHLVDATALFVFKGNYTRNGLIRAGVIAGRLQDKLFDSQ